MDDGRDDTGHGATSPDGRQRRGRGHTLIRAGAIAAVALAAGHLGYRALLADGGASPVPAVAADAADGPTNVEPVVARLAPDDHRFAPPDPAHAPSASVPTAAPEADEQPSAAPEDHDAVRFGHADSTPTPGPATPAETHDPRLAALDPAGKLPPDGSRPITPVPAPEGPALADRCAPELDLAARPMAMIAIDLRASCAAGARVVIRHAGLAVAETLDGSGHLTLDLPALDTSGRISVLLPEGRELHAAVAMPSVARLRRLAVQWIAGDAFQLHAMEGGATYGTPGDVHAQNPASPSGGYLVALGDPSSSLPMMAEVYTWPVGVTVRPVIEAEVTQATCGRELMAETLLSDHGRVTATDLTLAMPGCDALGDILVLNNLIGESRLAAAEH